MISDADVAAYERDGVVCLRAQFDARWIARLRAAIERDLASPGPYATNFAEGSTAGKFFGDMFMWKSDPDFHAAALESPAPAIAARLMGSTGADFFYDQLFVKEPGTAHPTPWHQDQPYWPVKGWQITSVWIALDPIDRSNYRPTPFRKGHEIKFTSSDLQQIPDIDAGRSKYDIRWWSMAPGDCLVFHAMIVHGAPGNDTPGARRRGLSLRYTGDDVRFAVKRKSISFPQDPGLRHGDRMSGELFPLAVDPRRLSTA